jgi:hypothetical protein
MTWRDLEPMKKEDAKVLKILFEHLDPIVLARP